MEEVIGINTAAGKFGVSKSSIQDWRRRYKAYSAEMKQNMLSGHERLQAKLNGLSPVEFRIKAA